MDTEVLRSYLPLFWEALILTVRIGWFGIALAFAIGIITSALLHFKVPVLSAVAKVYIELFRNTPLLVQLFFIY